MSDVESGAGGPFPQPVPEPAPESPPRRTRRKRRWGLIVTVVLLALALIATGAVLALTLVRLEEARTVIDENRELIEKQEELIDEKETFGAAMDDLVTTANQFEGTLFGSLVSFERYEFYAQNGWENRWDAEALGQNTVEVQLAAEGLKAVLAEAAGRAAGNVSGTTYERVIDELGRGFVDTAIDDADALCERDVLGCVTGEEPLTVHFDGADGAHPSMTDFIRTGVAYHEFAHVLQLTNPAPTATALESFGGDHETMADCFALTYLDGWKLDHRTWVSGYQYWDLSVGYGQTCDDAQKQVVRDWYTQLPIQARQVQQ